MAGKKCQAADANVTGSPAHADRECDQTLVADPQDA
jgi:hypothetical protein